MNAASRIMLVVRPTRPNTIRTIGLIFGNRIWGRSLRFRVIDDVYKALAEVGLKVIDTSIKDEWVSITSIKE